MTEKMPEIHPDLRPVAPKRAQIHVLALRLRRIGGRARHARREILDRQDIVMGREDLREQCGQVQPFPGRALQHSVVEIEAVDIDEGPHRCPPQKARTSEEAPRPTVETARGVTRNLVPSAMKIKSAYRLSCLEAILLARLCQEDTPVYSKLDNLR